MTSTRGENLGLVASKSQLYNRPIFNLPAEENGMHHQWIVKLQLHIGRFLLLRAAFVAGVFVIASASAQADVLVFDNFSCSDSVSLTGSGFHANFVSCPGSLGGTREDFIDVPTLASSVSTLASNPPSGAITGTFGSGITGFEGMAWGNVAGHPLPNLDLVGASIQVRIQSDLGGSVSVFFGDLVNGSKFSTAFAGSSGYQDVVIPLINPTVLGAGYNMSDVTAMVMDIGLNTGGGTWSIDQVEATGVPEPSSLFLLSICFLGMLTKSFWKKVSRA